MIEDPAISWKVFVKSFYKDLVLETISTQVIIKAVMESQNGMVLVALFRCNLINLFISKINSTIIQRRFLIIARKEVVIVSVIDLALWFERFPATLKIQEVFKIKDYPIGISEAVCLCQSSRMFKFDICDKLYVKH